MARPTFEFRQCTTERIPFKRQEEVEVIWHDDIFAHVPDPLSLPMVDCLHYHCGDLRMRKMIDPNAYVEPPFHFKKDSPLQCKLSVAPLRCHFKSQLSNRTRGMRWNTPRQTHRDKVDTMVDFPMWKPLPPE
jgi:hypothetical protein